MKRMDLMIRIDLKEITKGRITATTEIIIEIMIEATKTKEMEEESKTIIELSFRLMFQKMNNHLIVKILTLEINNKKTNTMSIKMLNQNMTLVTTPKPRSKTPKLKVHPLRVRNL